MHFDRRKMLLKLSVVCLLCLELNFLCF